VVPDGVEPLRRFASATGVGVLNSYGVKGLFRWDDPAHFGTIGLQARDVELAGVLDADVVLALGLDDRELGPADLGSRVEVVDATDLEGWVGRVEPMARGPLYDVLRSALLPLYDSQAVPLTPAAAVADLAAALPPGGLVCADPGPVGLWVARALPTLELGSVVVPPVDGDFARQHAREAGSGGRPVVYVTDRAVEEIDGVVVEVWTASGSLDAREARRRHLADALAAGGSHRLTTPVDLGLTRVLLDAAGPLTAWTA
jgi:hypothetical protein